MMASPTTRRCAQCLAVALAAVTGVAQQAGSAKADDPMVMIAAAERELTAGRAEDAMLLLWTAAAALQATPAGAARDTAEASLDLLLATADPLAAERKTRLAAAAQPLLAAARAYRGRKWTASANEIAALAFPFDAAAARKELPAGWSPTKVAPAASDDPLARFGRHSVDGNWTVVDGALCTPPLRQQSVSLITKTAHQDARIGATIDIGDRSAMLGIIVGAQGDDYYIVDHEFYAGSGDVRAAVYRFAGGELKTLGEKLVESPVVRKAPTRFEVTVEGTRVVARVDGVAIVEVQSPAPVRGEFGFYVSAASAYHGSLAIRAISLAPLQPGGADDAALAPGRGQESAVRDVVAEAERELQQKRVEPAVQLLRRARDLSRDLAAPARAPIVAAIDRQLAANDPLQPRWQKACSEAGAALRGLADAYAAAGRPRAAAVVAEAMFRLDPDAQRTRTEELRRAAAAAREPKTPPAEAPSPGAPSGGLGDNKALREWFAAGSEPFEGASAWQLGYDGAMSPLLVEGDSYRIAARGNDGLDAANVQFQLPRGASAGLAFAWQSTRDFARAVVFDGDDGGLDVEVQRWTDKGWVPLGRAHWNVSAAERDGWIQLGIRHDAGRIVVRCLGRGLTLANPGGQTGGRFGLYAGNRRREPTAVHFRAFVPGSEGPQRPDGEAAVQPGGSTGK
jgi:hypothetical protein